VLSPAMRHGASEIAAKAVEDYWTALGYLVERRAIHPHVQELDVFDGNIFIDTIRIYVHRRIKNG